MFLIFDTETTGLPKRWNAPLTDSDNWPRCIQIAWQLHDKNGALLGSRRHVCEDGLEDVWNIGCWSIPWFFSGLGGVLLF